MNWRVLLQEQIWRKGNERKKEWLQQTFFMYFFNAALE